MPTARRTLLIIVGLLVAIGLAITFVDRAAASWSYAHLHRPLVMVWLTHLVDPLEPVAIVGLAAAGLAAVCGWRPGEHGRAFMIMCVAVLISVAIKEKLKYFFGRTWPETWVADNPSWIRDHAYGFSLLHGGQGWASFPSGHTTQMAALGAVIWMLYPRARWLAVALVLAVAIGLWGADFHFVGDIIAGGSLGAACGIGAVRLIRRPTP